MFARDAHALEQNYFMAQRNRLPKVSNRTKDVGVQYSGRYKFSAESDAKMAFCSCDGANTCTMF